MTWYIHAIPKINAQSTRAISPNLIVIPLVDQKLTKGAARKLLGANSKKFGLCNNWNGFSNSTEKICIGDSLVKSLLNKDVRVSLDASALMFLMFTFHIKQKCSSNSSCW